MQNPNFDEMQSELGSPRKNTTSRENGITMLLCVLAALCIWFYVMSIDSPTSTETYSSVSVTVVNDRDTTTDVPLTAISGTGSVIEVTLKGRKTVLNDLRAEDIEAYVDVSDVETAGKGVYTVTVEAPDGTIIEDYYPKEITVYMDKRSIVTVPVRAILSQYNLVSGYTVNLANPVLSIDSIQVSGPQSELDDIDYARLSVSPGTITRSFSGTGSLTLIDTNGNEVNTRYLTLSATQATAQFSVYTTKTIRLDVAYKYGFFSENGTEVTIAPSEVEVKGPVEVLDTLTSHTVATIDETKITDDGVHGYDLNLPEGVELVDNSQSTAVSVNIHFDRAKLNKVRVPTHNIVLTNIPEGKHIEVLDEAITISVRGTSGNIMYMDASNFDITVNASLAVNNGDQYVPVTVAVRGGNTAALYTVGEYTVQIRVSEDEE